MTISLELDTLSAVATAGAVRARQVSAVEVVEAAIERIERRNPSLNAVTFKGYDDARDHARRLQTKIMAGESVGVLAGVPTLMKDLFGFKPGWPATLGSLSALKDVKASSWSTFPARVERADGIILGQTNSPVFGFRGTTDNKRFGPTNNPFDLTRNAGGSSGGSAAAVAGGLVSVAGATDGGGSIRIPSAWSGVVGFQPSAGRVPFLSRPNAFGVSCYLYEGPITRSVADCALAMTALHGYDPRDPSCLNEDVNFLGALHHGVEGKRIGFTGDYGIFPVETAVRSTIQEAAHTFESLGATVDHVEFDLPATQSELSDMWSRVTALGIHESIASMARDGLDLREVCPEELPAEMMHWVDRVPALTVDELIADQRLRTAIYDRFQAVFDQFDLVVAPTVACLPTANTTDGNTKGPNAINGSPVDPLIGWCMTYLTNFTGNPSASVPAGLSGGLPVGLQVTGPRYGDTTVMAAIAAFERARPWADIYRIPAQHTR
jgi:Asp-tRNA(Asn)/Glu-tRNA(Gln) amidotransferase A subunit family amidase